jgi:hypothetical protein
MRDFGASGRTPKSGTNGIKILHDMFYAVKTSAAMGNACLYYLDGKLIHTGNTSSATVDSRFSWLPEGVPFFADEDGKDADMDISNIAVWNRALSNSEIAALGGIE